MEKFSVNQGCIDNVRKILIRIKCTDIRRKICKVVCVIELAQFTCVHEDIRAFAVHDVHGKLITHFRVDVKICISIIIFAVKVAVIEIINMGVTVCYLDEIAAAVLVILDDRITDLFFNISVRAEHLKDSLSCMRIGLCFCQINDYELSLVIRIIRT